MIKRFFVFLAAITGTFAVAALPPESAMAQPAGTVGGAGIDAGNPDLADRAVQLTANAPSLAWRLSGGMATAGDLPVALSASGRSSSFDIALTTSLRQIAASERARRVRRLAAITDLLDPADWRQAQFGLGPARSGDGFAGWLASAPNLAEYTVEADIATDAAFDDVMPSISDLAATARATELDLWIDGTWSRVDGGDTTSDFGLLHIGADYRLSGNLLIGLLGQFDWSNEDEADAQNTQTDGFGWMIGPYAATRLHQHLIFDTRAAWGQSDNEVGPVGSDTDRFETERWLLHSGLTGDIHLDSWHLTPGISATYFEEEQKSYTDSLGSDHPNQTVSLGRLMFGPEAAYLYQPTAHWLIRPQIGSSGIWTFGDAEAVEVATGYADGGAVLRAQVEGGVSVTYADRYTLTGDVFYDGIGADDFDAYGGSLAIDVSIADGVLLGGEGFMTDNNTSAAANFGANLRLKLQLD